MINHLSESPEAEVVGTGPISSCVPVFSEEAGVDFNTSPKFFAANVRLSQEISYWRCPRMRRNDLIRVQSARQV